MKRFKKSLIGVVVLSLAIVSLAGCVSQSQYEALQTEHAALVQENTNLKAELGQAQSDLTRAQADYKAVRSDLTRAQADYKGVQSDLVKVQADYEAANNELAEIKEVYPPRDFSSFRELEDWLRANDVSERPLTTIAETWYAKALEIQEDAVRDGYIVSADLDYDTVEGDYYVSCITIIDGDIWAWVPETDEPMNYSSLADWQKVK